MPPQPHGNRPMCNINHIAICVPVSSIDAVADWYGKHFGFRKSVSANASLDSTQKSATSDPNLSEAAGTKDIRAALGEVKVNVAFLTSGNGVGFEIFEFVDPPTTDEYSKLDIRETHRRGGPWHVGVTVSDIEAKIKEICDDGGQLIGDVGTGFDDIKWAYTRDPWGNLVELVTASWDVNVTNRW